MDSALRPRASARRGASPTPNIRVRPSAVDMFSPVGPGSPTRPTALSFTPRVTTPRGASSPSRLNISTMSSFPAPFTGARPSFLDQSTAADANILGPTGTPSVVESNLRNLIREKEKELQNISQYKSMTMQNPTVDTPSMQSLKLDHEYNVKLLNQRNKDLEEAEARIKDLEASVEIAQREATNSKGDIDRLHQKLGEAQHIAQDRQNAIERLELHQHDLHKKVQDEVDRQRWDSEENAKNYKETLEKMRREMETEIRLKVQENKAQASELSKLRSTYQNSIEEAKSHFSAAEEKLRLALSNEMRRNEELFSENKSLKEFQKNSQSDLDTYKRQLVDLQSRLKASTYATEETQQESYQRIQQMTSSNSALQEEKAQLIAEYQSKVGELLSQLQTMEREISAQRLDYEKQNQLSLNQITMLQESEAMLRADFERTQNDFNVAQEDIERLAGELEESKLSLKKSQSDCQAADRRRQADALAIKDIQLNLDRKLRDCELKTARLEELETIGNSTDEEVINLKQTCENLHKKLQEASFNEITLKREAQTDRERLQTQLGHLNEKYSKAMEKVESHKLKNKETSDAVNGELEAVRQESNLRLTEAKTQIATLKTQNSLLTKQVRSAQDKIDTMNETIQSLSVNSRALQNSTAAVLLGSPRAKASAPDSFDLSGVRSIPGDSVTSGDSELVGMMKEQFDTLQDQLDGMKKKQKKEKDKKARKRAKEKEKEARRREKEKARAHAHRHHKEKEMERVYNSVIGDRRSQRVPASSPYMMPSQMMPVPSAPASPYTVPVTMPTYGNYMQ